MKKRNTQVGDPLHYLNKISNFISFIFSIKTKINLVLSIMLVGQLFFVSSIQAQSLDRRITFELRNESLQQGLNKLGKISGFRMAYTLPQVASYTNLSIEKDSRSVKEFLNILLSNTTLTYTIKDKSIMITNKANNTSTPNSSHKKVNISGTVTDPSYRPFPGVNIRVKGTTKVAATNMLGKYELEAEVGSILVYSFMGCKSEEVECTGNPLVNVILNEDAHQLNEVVVNTGYQKVEQRYLTSAVTSLKMDDIRLEGVNTVDQMLEGRIPGMIYMQNSGQVGAAPKLRIRGTSTVLGSREPLWVLDGIALTDPVNVDPSKLNDLDFVNLLGNAISGLNPTDIDQIDVLKDASATAIYGARAANGVIVITTKKGKVGPPTFTYSATSTIARRPRYTDNSIYLMNSKERIDVSREMINRKMTYNGVNNWTGYESALLDYNNGKINYDQYKSLVNKYETINTDWFDVVCRDAISTNHSLGISGGTQDTKYYASLGYGNEQSVIKGESGTRLNANANISTNYKNFTMQFSLQGNVSTRNHNPSELNVMNYAYNTSRAMPAYNADGTRWTYERSNNNTLAPYTYNYNILNEMDNTGNETKSNSINMTTQLGYRFSESFKLNATVNYSINNTNDQTYFTEDSWYIKNLWLNGSSYSTAPYGGELRLNNVRNNNYTARIQGDYNKYLGIEKKHYINVSAGTEISSSKYDGFAITKRGYSIARGNIFLSIPTTFPSYYTWLMSSREASGIITNQLTNIASGYFTTTYGYDDRYIFNFNARLDQSNQFGTRANENLLPLWSVSGRWNIKKDLLKNTNWVNSLSLRSSYGLQGNMIDNQTSQMIIQKSAMNIIFNEYASTIQYYPNPGLKWEKTASMNYSVDFGLLNNMISGSFSYYYKKTRDAFLSKTVSEINGVNQYIVNKGDLENQGVEVSLSFTPINNIGAHGDKKGFTWRIDPQLGEVVNRLVNKAISNDNNLLENEISYSDLLNGTIKVAGKSLGTFYSYKFKGLSNVDGSPIFYDAEDVNSADLALKYSSMNKKDVYLSVMTESGQREPTLQGGISNYFGYRNFALSFNFTYSLGNKIRLLKLVSGYGTNTPYPQDNMRKEFVDRWRKPGDELYTAIPGLKANNDYVSSWWDGASYAFASNIYEMYDNSDLRVVSGNYLKLQSLSLHYAFDEKLCKKIGLKTATLNLSGTNLFTIANKALKGQDPTQSGTTSSINLSVRPTYSCTLNVSF